MLRRVLLAAAASQRVRRVAASSPARTVVGRFVAGETDEAALAAATRLVDQGLLVSLDHLGEDTGDVGQAEAAVQAYLDLLAALAGAGLTRGARAEVSVKLTALGLALDPSLALGNARRVCAAAAAAGSCVTVDMEESAYTQVTLDTVDALRQDFPQTGAVVQAHLRRAEEDCRRLAVAGSRVRLCKGAYREPAGVAYQGRGAVRESYARCLGVLMAGPGYPMVATHDPRLVELATQLAARTGRDPGSFELQMLYGVRPAEQVRLAGTGVRVRVYLPYGTEWYGYLMRRLAERPANVALLLRALVGSG